MFEDSQKSPGPIKQPDIAPKFIPGVADMPAPTHKAYVPLKVGDETLIYMSDVPGAAMYNLPKGAMVQIRIDSFTNDSFTGPIMGVNPTSGPVARLPFPTLPVTISRKFVDSTYSMENPIEMGMRKK